MKSALLLLAAAATLSAQIDRVEGERIRPHVKFLSSDLLEGRGVGARGGQLAAEYIAAQFAAAGLKPGGENGTYFQRVPLRSVEVEPGGILTASAGDKSISFKWLDDFVATSHTQEPAGQFDAEAVFVGHGIVAPEYQWDDYKGVDVKGKVVVLFTNEPPSTDANFFKGKALTYYGRWTYKYEEAARQGAVAAIIIHTTPTASYGWQVLRANGRAQPQVRRAAGEPALTLAAWVTTDAGAQLLGLAGKTFDEMLQAADKRGFKAMPLGKMHVAGKFNFKLQDIETVNVAGVVPGSDPKLSSEAVLYSAHWDHLGIGQPVNGDPIYNGAIDNATGCGLLIEMARAWSSMEPKPLRSGWFVAVAAEESGLLGSRYFADHPMLPAAQIAANLNFDSFSPYGRVKDAIMTGADRTSFFPLVQSIAERHRLTIKPDGHPESGGYYRSDHYSFARVGIPAFSINMGGEYEGRPSDYAAQKAKEEGSTYHQPTDEYKAAWDFSGMEQFARFGLALGVEIGNLEKIPARVDAK
ncbi:M28 family peptidase [Paludibaculum fermentans]|uniref:M28 family peptidase n=1 Tax=Paludibaculum fermentans TaxID=1473598 RepID=UPI003EBDD54C